MGLVLVEQVSCVANFNSLVGMVRGDEPEYEAVRLRRKMIREMKGSLVMVAQCSAEQG